MAAFPQPTATSQPTSVLSTYRLPLLISGYILVTGFFFLQVTRKPYSQSMKLEQYESVFKGTTLAAVLLGIGISGGINKRMSEDE